MAKAVAASILAVVMLAVSGPGTKAGWWHFRIGMAFFAASALVALVALVLAAMAWKRSGRGALVCAIIALIVSAIVALPILSARGKPLIHDVSTDLDDPPAFVAIVPPQPGLDPMLQLQAYGDLKSLQVAMPTNEAFQRATSVVQSMGWSVAAADQARGIIEATDTTSWFGFKDDVVIRVKPSALGSKIDVRSTSRVGKSDTGTNAARIRDFLEEME